MHSDRHNAAARVGGRLLRRAAGVASASRTGLVLLAVIFLYLAAASLFPPPPGSPAGRLYSIWPLKLLLGLLVLNLVCATVRRVRLGWATLGCWLAHAGVVALAGGAAWYAARHTSGVAVTTRADTAAPFSRVERFFVKGTAAVYVTPRGGKPEQGAQTPLGSLPPSRTPRRLKIPVASGFDDVSITASRYLPAAVVALEWHDDGPAEIPAVEVVIEDGSRRFRRVLCPAYPHADRFDAGGYAVYLAPTLRGLDEQDVRKGPAEASEVKDAVVIAPAGGAAAEVGVFDHWGKPRGVQRVATGEQVKLSAGGRQVGLTVVRFFTRAWLVGVAAAASPGKAPPAVRLDVRVGDWRGSQWIGFDPYVRPPDPADRMLQRLPLPGGRMIYLHFAPQSRPLPRPFRVKELEYRTYPGSTRAMDYSCVLELAPAGAGEAERVWCRLNQPADVAGVRVYQNTWSPGPDAPDEIVFTVSSRPGIEAVWLGCILICLALPYAFYVKPLLLRRRRRAGQ